MKHRNFIFLSCSICYNSTSLFLTSLHSFITAGDLDRIWLAGFVLVALHYKQNFFTWERPVIFQQY